jgi:hypothetical protein
MGRAPPDIQIAEASTGRAGYAYKNLRPERRAAIEKKDKIAGSQGISYLTKRESFI